MGTLLPGTSGGFGAAIPTNATYGTLDLGGASTQISFFIPSQDISEGLFKLQIGSQRHWNIYAVSYLQFGIVSARLRYINALITNQLSGNGDSSLGSDKHEDEHDDKHKDEHDDKHEENSKVTIYFDFKNNKIIINIFYYCKADHSKHRGLSSRESAKCSKSKPCNAVTSCFFSGYKESAQYDNQNGTRYSFKVSGPEKSSTEQLRECIDSVRPLMEKSINSFCNWVYDNQVN